MKRIAVCMSGHIRLFSECYDNIYQNFIKLLIDSGYQPDFFVSFWNVGGLQGHWEGEANFDSLIRTLNPKALLIEEFDRQSFINRFNSQKWKEYSHLSGPTTCGDSISMWYKVQTSWDMVMNYEKRYGFEYDAITRIRPDVIFDNPFDTSIFEDIESNDVVYIPRWHGKWPEVSMTFTDYFGIGNRVAMSHYMSVYNNVQYLLNCDKFPHTGEGLLCGQLQNVTTKRLFNIGFSIQRHDRVDKMI